MRKVGFCTTRVAFPVGVIAYVKRLTKAIKIVIGRTTVLQFRDGSECKGVR